MRPPQSTLVSAGRGGLCGHHTPQAPALRSRSCGVWAASVGSLCKPTLADHVNSVPDHHKWSIVPCVFHARSLCIQRNGPFGAGGRRTSFRHSPGILFSCDCEDTSSRSKAAQATAVRECQLGWVAAAIALLSSLRCGSGLLAARVCRSVWWCWSQSAAAVSLIVCEIAVSLV